jgi:hypothetical protein
MDETKIHDETTITCTSDPSGILTYKIPSINVDGWESTSAYINIKIPPAWNSNTFWFLNDQHTTDPMKEVE